MPCVFLFRNGGPIRCLGTDAKSKCVVRVPFFDIVYEREVGHGKELAGTSSNRAVEAMRQKLMEYSQERGYDKHQAYEEKKKVCTVFYMDGNQEELDLWTLDILLQNDVWRLQILLLQGYVPSTRTLKAHYSTSIEEATKTEAMKTKATKLTKILATYAERAYKVRSCGRGRGHDTPTININKHKPPTLTPPPYTHTHSNRPARIPRTPCWTVSLRIASRAPKCALRSMSLRLSSTWTLRTGSSSRVQTTSRYITDVEKILLTSC